jgi:hypothetical protein
MRRLSLVAMVLAVAAATSTWAQTAASCPSATTLPDLLKAVDDAISGPGNKDRTCMRQLFTSDARLMPLVKGQDGKWAPRILTVDDWITRVAKRGEEAFYEHQIKYAVDEYGHMAHLWSTYEIRETPDGKPTARGINSIQAVNDGGTWKIVQILWETEAPDEPLPAKFLP